MFHPAHAVLSHAPLARAALRATTVCVAALVLIARTASSQQSGKVVASKATMAPTQAATSTADSVVCDTVAAPAAAPRKSSVARPRNPARRVAASTVPRAAAKPRPAKRPGTLAHAKRPRPSQAAGRRVASSAPARRTSPPQCRTVAAAPAPQVGAMADLVNSLPWTPPADVAFPQATAPSLGDFTEGVALRTGTLAAGLLGAGAVWLGSGDHGDTPPAIVVTPPPGETPPGGELPPVTTVPEPATLALVASGLAAIGARSRRRKG